MFIAILTYLQPLEVIDQHLISHRAFLETGYQKNYLIASGPQTPRTGGILLSQLKDKALFESFIQEDPFYIFKLANYEIIEFTPVKNHPDFSKFL